MIELSGISKVYQLGGIAYPALTDINLSIGRNEFIALTGASGSGKSTMMNILGCLDTPTAGRYTLDGEEVAGLDEEQLASVRNRKVGFVFQNFYLMPRMTAIDNVAQPLIYRGISPAQRRAHAERALGRVGLGDRMRHRPNEMSGNYFDVKLGKTKQPQRVGDITLLLKNTDPKKNKYTVQVMADDKLTEKKDRNINEPVQFYTAKGGRIPYELVINKVDKNLIVGYLATPKVTETR